MAEHGANVSSAKRFHIALIPGFFAFDAVGQLEYYAGVTPLFQAHRAGDEVLHYFDNFPTAAVVTRATRLQEYVVDGGVAVKAEKILKRMRRVVFLAVAHWGTNIDDSVRTGRRIARCCGGLAISDCRSDRRLDRRRCQRSPRKLIARSCTAGGLCRRRF